MKTLYRSLVTLLFLLGASAFAAQPGDVDGDGDVDGADFVIWQTNFGNPVTGQEPSPGDMDADFDCDGADFVVWQTNFPYTPGAASVPEPSTVALAILSLPAIFLPAIFALRRRRSRHAQK